MSSVYGTALYFFSAYSPAFTGFGTGGNHAPHLPVSVLSLHEQPEKHMHLIRRSYLGKESSISLISKHESLPSLKRLQSRGEIGPTDGHAIYNLARSIYFEVHLTYCPSEADQNEVSPNTSFVPTSSVFEHDSKVYLSLIQNGDGRSRRRERSRR